MRILVVGLGSMGRRRLRNLTHIGGHELAGMEPWADRAREVASEFGIEVFPDIAAGLAWRPDALVISTPPDQHTAIALEAVRNGLPFFTEASVVAHGMDELIAAVDAAGTLGAPSCTMRFHPAVQVIRERIASGTIGRPLIVTNHAGQYLPDWHPWEDYRTFYVSRRETGAAREIVPFELNWLTYLFGPVSHLAALRGKVSDLEVDIDDVYSGVFVFQNGVQGSMVIDVVSRPAIRRARIAGELGTLVWDWNGHRVQEWTAATNAWEDFPDPDPVEGPGGGWVAENMYIEEMLGYLRAIEGIEDWPLPLREDRLLLDVVQRMERSSDQVLGT